MAGGSIEPDIRCRRGWVGDESVEAYRERRDTDGVGGLRSIGGDRPQPGYATSGRADDNFFVLLRCDVEP